MKERAYPVYTVNKHAEGLLVGGHPWVYENDILGFIAAAYLDYITLSVIVEISDFYP